MPAPVFAAEKSRSHSVLAWVVQAVVALGLWFLFVANFTLHELLVGAVVAAIGATLSEVVRRRGVAWFDARGRDLAQVFRVPKYLVTGTWEILTVLFAQLFLGERAKSMLLAVSFDPGGDDAESVARRALAVAYTSATPNFVVLGVDREHGRLIFHQIKRSSVPEMTKRLGALPRRAKQSERRSRPTPPVPSPAE